MARARTLLLVVAALLVGADAVELGVHDFGDPSTNSADGLTTTLPGKEFKGQSGKYTLRVDPAWPHHSDVPFEGFEIWEVAEERNGLRPNLGILVENLPIKVSIEDYLEASVANLPKQMAGATVANSHIVNGAFAQRLGVIEYTASVQGHPLQFFGVVAVHDKHAAVATVTAPADRFAEIHAAVEPYLLTLRAI